MVARDQVEVPSQHRDGAHEQPQSTQYIARDLVQQRRQERPIARPEPRPVPARLPLQNHDLMPQRQEFHVLVAVAHR
ncbi:hypothetical protein [Streptomyces sp. NPDC055140]